MPPTGPRQPPTGPRDELKRPRSTTSYSDPSIHFGTQAQGFSIVQETNLIPYFDTSQTNKRVRRNESQKNPQSNFGHYTEESTATLISPTSPIEDSEHSEVEFEEVDPSKQIAVVLESWLEQIRLRYPSAKFGFGEKDGKMVVICAHCVEIHIEIDFNKPDFTKVDLHLNTPLHEQNVFRNIAGSPQIEDVLTQRTVIQDLKRDERSVEFRRAHQTVIELTSHALEHFVRTRLKETNGRIDEIANKLANLLLKEARDDDTLAQMEIAIRVLSTKKGDTLSQTSTLQVLQNDVMRVRTEINALAVKEGKTQDGFTILQEDVAKSQTSIKVLLSNAGRMTTCLKTMSERDIEDRERASGTNAAHIQTAKKNAGDIQTNTENIMKALDVNRKDMTVRLDTLSEQVIQDYRANETHIHTAKRMVENNQTKSEVMMKALDTNAKEMTIRLDTLWEQAIEDRQRASHSNETHVQTAKRIVEDLHTKTEVMKKKDLSYRKKISSAQTNLASLSNGNAQKLELLHQEFTNGQKIASDDRVDITRRVKNLEGKHEITSTDTTSLREEVVDLQRKIEADCELVVKSCSDAAAGQITSHFQKIGTQMKSDYELNLERFNTVATTHVASCFNEIEAKMASFQEASKEQIGHVVKHQFSLLDEKLNQTAETFINIQKIEARNLETMNRMKFELAASQNSLLRAQAELRQGQEAMRVKREDAHDMLQLEHETLSEKYLSTKISLSKQIIELGERIDRRDEYMEEQRIRHEKQMMFSRQANDEHVAGLLAASTMAEKKGQQETQKKLDALMQRIDTLENTKADTPPWPTPILAPSPKPWPMSTPTLVIEMERSIVAQEFSDMQMSVPMGRRALSLPDNYYDDEQDEIF